MDQKQQNSAQPAQVMDIKPQQPAGDETATPQVPADVAESFTDPQQDQNTVSMTPAEMPVAASPAVTDTKEEPEAGQQKEAIPSQPEEPAKQQKAATLTKEEQKEENKEPKAAKPGSNKNPAVLASLVVLVGISLAGAAVFMYMRSNAPGTNNATPQISSEDPQRLVETVDEATAEVDTALDALNADDDFGSSELSEETLGL